MLPSDFDRLVARASNPRLISGIYNYCDRWCERCRFTDRCLQFLEDQEAEPPAADAESLAGRVRESLARRLGTITEIARRQHIDLRTLEAPSSDAAEKRDRHGQDPLVVSARQYGDLAWRLARALGAIVAARRSGGHLRRRRHRLVLVDDRREGVSRRQRRGYRA
jgi:hypothetical protein